MLDNLRPFSGEHSISRVVSTIHIPQAFLKPTDVFDKIKDLSVFNSFPKKGILKSTKINIQNNKLGISNEEGNGFMFESYNEKGGLSNLFKLENIGNKAIISLENRSYTDWDEFKSLFNELFNGFSSQFDFYVEAISLSYRDEFFWNSPEEIPIEEIFNSESELLNKKFLNSKNGTLVLISQGKDKSGFPNEEKTEVSFSNDLKRIIIDHTYALKVNKIELFSAIESSNNFLNLYDNAHIENKNVLEDLLTQNSQNLIGLK
jgi:uncharacterized protein (TIGR04255 family)